MDTSKLTQLHNIIADLKNEAQITKKLLVQKREAQPETGTALKTKDVIELIAFVKQSKYIDVKEQPNICKNFGLPYLKYIFQNEYRNRFFEYLKENTTTVATVSNAIGIPHKYLCICKAYYEKKGVLKVVAFGKCPTTGSKNVQFVSTNSLIFYNYVHKYESNQLMLFQ